MNDLLEYCLRTSCLGYTLFGNKPVSVISFPRTIQGFMKQASSSGIIYYPSLVVLERNISRFQSEKYIVQLERDEESIHIWAINIQSLKRVYSENIDLFQAYLDANGTVEELLSQLFNSKKTISAILQQHCLLYGLVFGYGRENAQLFYQRDLLESLLNIQAPTPFLPHARPLIHHKKMAQGLCNTSSYKDIISSILFMNRDALEKELKDTHEKIQHISILYGEREKLDLAPVVLPAFVGDITTEESKRIALDYLQTRAIIQNVLYSSNSYLEGVLNQIHQ